MREYYKALVVLSILLSYSGNVMPNVDKFLKAAATGKLSTRDRQFLDTLSRRVKMTQEEEAADMLANMSPVNMKELSEAIKTAPTLKQKAILMQEHDRLVKYMHTVAAEAEAAKMMEAEKSSIVDTPSMMDTIGKFLSNIWSSK